MKKEFLRNLTVGLIGGFLGGLVGMCFASKSMPVYILSSIIFGVAYGIAATTWSKCEK